MIQRVYEQASKSLDYVYVATVDDRIFNTAINFVGKAIMTSPDHNKGTERCAEAVSLISRETGKIIYIIINIQGDESFIKPDPIELLKRCFTNEEAYIATLIRKNETGEDIFNPNQQKVIVNSIRDAEKSDWSKKHVYY